MIWKTQTTTSTKTQPTPSSPYSASKASSTTCKGLYTYGLPVLSPTAPTIMGPTISPKLITHMILSALAGKLPVYGDGSQYETGCTWRIAKASTVVHSGKVGETYIGGHNERKNLQVVEDHLRFAKQLRPEKPPGVSAYKELITFVTDRPGHDLRFAIDASKIEQLGWQPVETRERHGKNRRLVFRKSGMVADDSGDTSCSAVCTNPR